MNTAKVMEELLVAIGTLDEIYPKIREMSPGGFVALIGLMTDQYAADHDVPAADLHEMLYEASKGVFKDLGEMQKTPGGLTS